MNKVYIVTSGCYSDYTIEAVFSTYEKAQEYIHKRSGLWGTGDDCIECFELDEAVKDGRIGYSITFDDKDPPSLQPAVNTERCYRNEFYWQQYYGRLIIEIFLMAENQESALKIAKERYGMIKANIALYEKGVSYNFYTGKKSGD